MSDGAVAASVNPNVATRAALNAKKTISIPGNDQG